MHALPFFISIAYGIPFLLLVFRGKLVDKMRKGPYAIYTDGSNDNGLQKMMPITVSVLDESRDNGISNEFLDICMTSSATAEGKKSLKGYTVLHFLYIIYQHCDSIAFHCFFSTT